MHRVVSLAYHRLIRMVQLPRIALYQLLSNNSLIGKPKRLQPIQTIGKGSIIIGENVTVGYFPSPCFFSTYAYLEARGINAEIKIGSNTSINNNISIISENAKISIGENCLIGINVEIIDSDFHPISPKKRREGIAHQAKSVSIGRDVFVGSNVKILKGVVIGDGAVIANGAVVTKNIPPLAVAGGNPAEVIKYVEE